MNTRNVLVFSKSFIENKYNTFLKDGYKLSNGNVEYLLYWYDAIEDKEYKIVLPKLKFSKEVMSS
jgi:ATP-dependent DNA helicase RecQ